MGKTGQTILLNGNFIYPSSQLKLQVASLSDASVSVYLSIY